MSTRTTPRRAPEKPVLAVGAGNGDPVYLGVR
jgi:hypothetical protein